MNLRKRVATLEATVGRRISDAEATVAWQRGLAAALKVPFEVLRTVWNELLGSRPFHPSDLMDIHTALEARGYKLNHGDRTA